MVDFLGVVLYAWLLGWAVVGMRFADRNCQSGALSSLAAMGLGLGAFICVPKGDITAGLYDSDYVDNYLARALIGGWDPIANQLKMSAETGVIADNSIYVYVILYVIVGIIGAWWAIASANR